MVWADQNAGAVSAVHIGRETTIDKVDAFGRFDERERVAAGFGAGPVHGTVAAVDIKAVDVCNGTRDVREGREYDGNDCRKPCKFGQTGSGCRETVRHLVLKRGIHANIA